MLKTGDSCPCCGQPIKTKDPAMLALLTYIRTVNAISAYFTNLFRASAKLDLMQLLKRRLQMKFKKENVRITYCEILGKLEMWFVDGKEAEKQLAYIMGLRDMANAVIEAIEKLEGM